MRDSDLHAYVDGQLDSARRIEVETWLAEDEEAARRVEAYRAQNAALHSLFDSILNERLDGRLADLGEQLGERLDAKLAQPVPVMWVYVTAWAENDVVNFRNDIYNIDGVNPGVQAEDTTAATPAVAKAQ